MIAEIRRLFDDAIKDKLKSKPELMRIIIKHERKESCLDNIARELRAVEFSGIKMTKNTRDQVIKDCAIMFAKAAIQHLEEREMSAMAKRKMIDDANRIKEAESMLQDITKEAINEKGLTEIEREKLIKEFEETWPANEIQT